jgi:predicted transcriptional regulator
MREDVAGGENSERLRETPREWSEEQLRYQVLTTVYAHTGAHCEREVTGTMIGSELKLKYEDLFRIIHFLEYNGYLDYRGSGPRVCITEKGIRYLLESARRRRSIRSRGLDLRLQHERQP